MHTLPCMSVNIPKCLDNQSNSPRKFEWTLTDTNYTFTDRNHERLPTFCHWAVFPGWLCRYQSVDVHPPPPQGRAKVVSKWPYESPLSESGCSHQNNLDRKHLICIKQDGRRKNYDFTIFVISPFIDGIFM